jgi:hypothetical protein
LKKLGLMRRVLGVERRAGAPNISPHQSSTYWMISPLLHGLIVGMVGIIKRAKENRLAETQRRTCTGYGCLGFANWYSRSGEKVLGLLKTSADSCDGWLSARAYES